MLGDCNRSWPKLLPLQPKSDWDSEQTRKAQILSAVVLFSDPQVFHPALFSLGHMHLTHSRNAKYWNLQVIPNSHSPQEELETLPSSELS